MDDDICKSDKWIDLSLLLLDSFEYFLDRPLIDRVGDPEQQARRLFRSPNVVVAHGTQADPILCYANRSALELWASDLTTILTMPSRKTAEPVERAERAGMLARSLEYGFIDDYHGIRVTTTGKRFYISNAIIWNLVSSTGKIHGQAATFSDWHFVEE